MRKQILPDDFSVILNGFCRGNPWYLSFMCKNGLHIVRVVATNNVLFSRDTKLYNIAVLLLELKVKLMHMVVGLVDERNMTKDKVFGRAGDVGIGTNVRICDWRR